ncbi:MAG: hypothetical protein MNPFHGCM_02924 [Gemmatimonadaceae bacterium]|nr:hypothetical protein [Gemmatimonadaceae bacterium]
MRRFPVILSAALVAVAPAGAQSWTSADQTIRRIFAEGMDSSQTYRLAQSLLDSIGPRLTGTPGMKSGNDWLVRMYTSWGVPARNEQYGTWRGWRRGISHVDLLTPRVRTLEGGLLAWSPGTMGKDVTGSVVVLPQVTDSAAFVAWLPQAKGKFVLVSFPEPTCRPDADWQQYATPESVDRMKEARTAARAAWQRRVSATGYSTSLAAGSLGRRLGEAGAAGVLTTRWDNGGWGTRRVFGDLRQVVPALEFSCEDYGLLFRLAENNQGPTIRLRAEAEPTGEVPVFNTIAELKGSEKPNEYVVLSAHFDSWDAGSGATDNGTGTLTMLEAMRILKKVYPNPKRTIVVGHWSGEEQGLNGSRAWAQDHPEVVNGLQALFNQDNGTGRVVNLGSSGLVGAAGFLARWMASVPTDIARFVQFSFPGAPPGGGSDNASFACYGAPGFGLGALDWNYGMYTWHTNRDTFDKVVFDDLRNNATLTAMLAYLASEDPQTVPRDRRVFESGPRQSARGPGGFPSPTSWPTCTPALRDASGYTR